MKATVNGVALNYVVEGREGAPWLTFSNSLATNLGMWDDQVAAFKGDWRILRYDKRGHGASAATPGTYPIELLVQDVLALWDSLGVTRSHFVGLSIGGMIGFGLALDHADRLASLCVCCTRADSPPSYNAAWPGRVAIAETKGMAALVDATLDRWFSPGFRTRDTAAMARMGKMISTTSVAGYVGCAYALQNLPYLPRLGAITTPTLCVGGSNDILLEGTRDAHKAIAGSTYVELGPAGHIANIEQPEQFTAAIGAFLAKHRG